MNHLMLQVTRNAIKFASAQQQLVQRVVRRKGESELANDL
jgi:hypothetical protein